MRNSFGAPVVMVASLFGGSVAAQATAQDRIEVVIQNAGQRDADGSVLIDLRAFNDGDAPATLPLPDMIEAHFTVDGTERFVWLERDMSVPEHVVLVPGGFVRVRYRLPETADDKVDGAILSIPALSGQQVVVNERAYTGSAASPSQLASAEPEGKLAALKVAPPPADRSVGNHFLGNFSAYQPIYAVYGPGTDTEARLQFSFQYRLFGSNAEGSPDLGRDGLHFAYTQRMFWDLGSESFPFRNIDFQPELFYALPSKTFASGVSVSAQAGFSHQSNGRDGTASRGVNSLYLAPMAAIPMGDDYRLTIAPRVDFYVGSLADNPDIRRYRGNTGLAVEIGKDDGFRLTTATRFNFDTGKGAFSADISYPLPRILKDLPSVYLFGQSFVGYGENLLDYDRHVTRLRIGVALVR